MTKIFFALICVLLLQPFKASCQTNWKLTIDGNDFKSYFNSSNIIKRKNSIVVWTKYVKSLDRKAKELKTLRNSPIYDRCDTELLREIIDFKSHRSKLLSMIRYLDGIQVYEYQSDENNVYWKDIIPDTPADADFVFFKKYFHIKN